MGCCCLWKAFSVGGIHLLSVAVQNLNDLIAQVQLVFLLLLSFTIEIFFPTKCKREAGVKGQTFLEVIVASLKSQGKKERTTLDNCIQKESDCLGLKLNNVWIPALFWNRPPEGACGVDERETSRWKISCSYRSRHVWWKTIWC